MKKFLFPLLIMALLLSGCGGDSQNIQDMRHGNVIIIGVDDAFPPMAFRDENGKIIGFDIDLAKEASKRMGITFEFKPIDWDKKREEITSGNVDIIWNGLDISDERKEYMLFSKPYMEDRQIFLVKKGNTQGIRSEDDFIGKIVGVQAGATSESFIKSDKELRGKLKEFKTYKIFKDALDALSCGEIDVLICDEIAARYEMRNQPDQFEVIPLMDAVKTEMGIGFRKDDVELCERVQKVFDEIVKDGTAKKISEKWFQADLIISHK